MAIMDLSKNSALFSKFYLIANGLGALVSTPRK